MLVADDWCLTLLASTQSHTPKYEIGKPLSKQKHGNQGWRLGLVSQVSHRGGAEENICGTPNYIAPEIIAGHSHSFEFDVWSLGVIMFTMLCGKPPFETKDVKSTYKKIKSCEFSFPSHVTVSHAAKSLINSILQLNADKRPTLDQMLCREWFTGVRAIIPKRLPVSALHMEPNFFI